MHHDARGHAVTVSDPRALEAYERALYAWQTYRGDPLAPLDEALALDSGFAAAYAAKALILCTLFERRYMRDALAVLDAGRDALAAGTARERALGAAARCIAEGDWTAGSRALQEVLIQYPRELVALQPAHILDFVRGDAISLRSRVSRVLPAWSAAVPGYAYVLGMHAFGLEECNQYAEAERAGRTAVELSGDDCWAVHAVAHVMEMQGRIAEGLTWYEDTRAVWAGEDNGFAFHNAWHTALYRMDTEDYGDALRTYDERFGQGCELALVRVDATALLWRLMLEGVEVASRFARIADEWEQSLAGEGGFYAFNDFHAALAFAATGRDAALAALASLVERSASARDSNGEMARLVGMPLVRSIAAYGEGRFALAAEGIGAVRDVAARFGGSHAQRDLLTLTLIDAATRARLPTVARHYANERLVHKPSSAWGRRLVARASTQHECAPPRHQGRSILRA